MPQPWAEARSLFGSMRLILWCYLELKVMDDPEAAQTIKTYAVEVSVKKHDLNRSHDVLFDTRGWPNRAYAIADLITLLLSHDRLSPMMVCHECSNNDALGQSRGVVAGGGELGGINCECIIHLDKVHGV